MRKLNKIIVLCLVFSMIFSMPIFAEDNELEALNDRFLSDLGDIERVYKYDMIEKQEQIEIIQEEVLKYPDDVQLVTALGIMDYLSDGNFQEDKNVPFNEFAQMLVRLRVGVRQEIENQASENGDTRPAKMGEAVHYLVEILGYHYYEPKYTTDKPRYQIAREIGILKGVSFLEDKLVTRGEMACMLANALEIDLLEQTAFGDKQKYEAVSGKNILQEYFSVTKVEGLVTAIPGINLFGGTDLEAGNIEIDRVSYRANGIDPTYYIGHRVVALLEIEDNRENIISLQIDKDDKSMKISFSDIVRLSSSEITYQLNEKEEKISLREISTVTRNGERVNSSVLDSSLLYKSGELMLCSSSKDGKFDIAAIRLYEDYVVQSVSGISEKITLAYGQKFNGNTYINTRNSVNYTLNIVKNGEQISADGINAGDVITVVANNNFSIINIIVSDKKVTGEIKETKNNKVVIGKNEYMVSNSYKNAMLTELSLPQLEVRTVGTFYVSFDERIVGYKNSSSNLHYGYMTKMKKGEGFDDSVEVRIFNDEGEWVNYPLAKYLTLDGEARTSREDAYTILSAAQSQAFEDVVRFETNNKEELIFLDTARIKALSPGQTDPEASDMGRIRFVEHFNESFNWKQEGVLNRSQYLVSKDAVLFRVPTDKEEEELYTVTKGPKFGQGTKAELDLYSPNEFNMIPLIKQESTGGQISNDTLKYFVVMDIGTAIDKKGNLVNSITCFCHETNKWEVRKFYTTSTKYTQGHGLTQGDLVAYTAVGDELQDYIIKIPASARSTDFSYGLLYYPAYALGTVTDIDAEANLIKFVSGAEECVFVPLAIGIYSSSENKGYSGTVGDLQVTDRIYVFGAHKNFTVIALR